MIKAVVLDLDNTLLRSDKSLSDYSRGVLAKCREHGIRVLAASARPERTIREFGVFGEFEALVTLNGARILLPNGELVNAIPPFAGEAVLARLMDRADAVLSVETDGGIFSNVPIPEWNSLIYNGFPRLPEGVLYKILASRVTKDDVLHALAPHTYFTAIEGGLLYQIMDKTATKWNGVREMLAAFGIDPKETAYFGDDWDDLDCVHNCGLGVAMSNAIPEVRAVADAVAGPCDEDGAARFIEKELL